MNRAGFEVRDTCLFQKRIDPNESLVYIEKRLDREEDRKTVQSVHVK